MRTQESEKDSSTHFRTARTQDRTHILPSLQATERRLGRSRGVSCKEGNVPIAEFSEKKRRGANEMVYLIERKS